MHNNQTTCIACDNETIKYIYGDIFVNWLGNVMTNKINIGDFAKQLYTTIRHNICLKIVAYFCKRTVLKVLCYQNIYVENYGRNVHVHKFIGDSHSE